MNKSAHLRSGLRIVVALSIALLTVVSPLCSPLCAATVCSSGKSAADSGLDGCHHASASAADAHDAIAAPQLCNLKEMPAAALRDAKSSIEKHAKRISSSHANSAAASASLANHLSQPLWLAGSGVSRDKPPTTTVLRI
jgi:hypothetical protein